MNAAEAARSVACIRFVPNQVARTIEPHLPLTRVIRQWNPVPGALAEPKRRRPSQLAAFPTSAN